MLSDRGTAIILFVVYLAYLYFQLKSHADLFVAEEGEEEEEEPAMGLWSSVVALLAVTLLTAFCAGQFFLHSPLLPGSALTRPARFRRDAQTSSSPQSTRRARSSTSPRRLSV